MTTNTDVLHALHNRRSTSRLIEPGPNAEGLSVMLECAQRAPDHGRIRPWHFRVFEDADRSALGDQFAASYRARCESEGTAPNPMTLERERHKVERAPVIIVVGTRLHECAIPAIEQIAATAAATQNLLLAAGALGYGTMWRTGAAAYDTNVKEFVGLRDNDPLLGFVSVGTIPNASPSRARSSRD